MLRFIESKVTTAKGLRQEDFAVGPMQLSEGDRGTSFLATDDHDVVEAPTVLNDYVVEPSMKSIAEDEWEELVVRPSNVYVLVSSSNLFLESWFIRSVFSLSVPNTQYTERCILFLSRLHGRASSLCSDSTFAEHAS